MHLKKTNKKDNWNHIYINKIEIVTMVKKIIIIFANFQRNIDLGADGGKTKGGE